MRSLPAVLRGAFADAAARRSAFWTQVAAMVLNDVAWVAFWLLFFGRVRTVHGWDAHRVLMLFAVLTTSAGMVLGLLSNSRRLPDLIREGALDETLSLPVPALPYLLLRRVDTVNLGDVLFGALLFSVAGRPTPARIAIYLGGSLAAGVLLTGFLVTVGSLAFFTGRGEPGGLGLQAMLTLASYPVDIFSGTLKALLYTAIPAAFVAAVPADLIDRPTWGNSVALVGISATFAVLGWLTFTLGLRRYTSGATWSRG
jgi:ABC-2 type transport system permease protein